MAAAVAQERDSPRPKRRRVGIVLLVIAAVIVAIAIIVRLILDPIASHETRKALGNLPGIGGDFERVHVTIFPPSYQITNLKLVEAVGKPGGQPLVFVKDARVAVSWHDLVRGHLVASATLHEPKITVFPPRPVKGKPPPTTPDLSQQLAQAPSGRLGRIEIFAGQILVAVPQGHERPRLWVHDLDVAGQNLATRPTQAKGRPASVSARGVVGQSGALRVFVTADPFASPLAFAGEASLKGLRATELYEFLAAEGDLAATSGTIDLFASFTSKNGTVSGGVKPVLKNIELKSTDEGFWAKTETWLLDKGVDLASDRVPERNAVATTIPIKGRLADPDIQLWPAVLGVIRNAFVAGLASGFSNLPPDTAPKKEGVVKQAVDALKKNEGPPQAQPKKP